jgi:hypothetical protein
MSRAIGPHIGPFLQHRIEEWLREACAAIGRVLGYDTVGALELEARAWWIEHGHPDPSPPSRRVEHPLLRDRPEYAQVISEALADRPEIDEQYFEQFGQIYDSDSFPRPLNHRFVGNITYALFIEGKRGRPR